MVSLAAVDVQVKWGLGHDMWQEYIGSSRSTGYLDLALPTKHNQHRVLKEVAEQAQKDMGAREMNADVADQVRARMCICVAWEMQAWHVLGLTDQVVHRVTSQWCWAQIVHRRLERFNIRQSWR